MKVANKVKAVKTVKSYGHLNLSSRDFPGISDLTLSEKLTLTIEVDITALRKPDPWEVAHNGGKPNDITASVNILGVTLPAKKKE
jgi:hypothetical protein